MGSGLAGTRARGERERVPNFWWDLRRKNVQNLGRGLAGTEVMGKGGVPKFWWDLRGKNLLNLGRDLAGTRARREREGATQILMGSAKQKRAKFE